MYINLLIVVNLANDRVVESINQRRSGGSGAGNPGQKRRDQIMGFDVTGIIKLLSNKTKMISFNLLPIAY